MLVNRSLRQSGIIPTGTIPITQNGVVDVTNYASADVNVSSGGGTEIYTRPSDWLTIPTMSGITDEIYILNAVALNGENVINFKVIGSGTIDWGDGTTDSFSSSSLYNLYHAYNYNNVSSNSWTNYSQTRQALIHINCTRGTLTRIVLYNSSGINYTNGDGNTSAYLNNSCSDILQISGNVASCQVQLAGDGYSHRRLEIFEWVGTLTSITFSGCYALQKIDADLTGLSVGFRNCTCLKEIELDCTNRTNFYETFAGCTGLIKVKLNNMNNATNTSRMFQNCSSLVEVSGLNLTSSTDCSYMFEGCKLLSTLEDLNTKNCTSMTNMFNECFSLRNVQINTSKVEVAGNMFSSCYSLQNVHGIDLSNFNISGNTNIFYQNRLLQNITLYNFAKNSTVSSVNITDMSGCRMMTKQQLVTLFNSLPTNTSYTRGLQLGTTLRGYLSSCYVVPTATYCVWKLPTNDNSPVSGKTYYTYNKQTGNYDTFTGSTFETNILYYEDVTSTEIKYEIGESTDTGAMLALNWVSTVKGWTVS